MLDDGLIIAVRWNASGELDELPPEVEELTGYTAQETKEKVYEIVTPESAEMVDRVFEEEKQWRGPTTSRVIRLAFHHQCGCVNEAEAVLVFRRNRLGELTEIHGIVRKVVCPCSTELTMLWPSIPRSGQFAICDLARVFAGAPALASDWTERL